MQYGTILDAQIAAAAAAKFGSARVTVTEQNLPEWPGAMDGGQWFVVANRRRSDRSAAQ
jgi:hypothetical protein